MKILELDEDNFRSLDIEEVEKVAYSADSMRIRTLKDYLGYEIMTDGTKVYAVNGDDIIEVGAIEENK